LIAAMRPSLVVLFTAALGLAGCQSAGGVPRNLGLLKDEIRAYHAGPYPAQVAAVAARAGSWLEQRVAAKRTGERLTAVFDLDETLLSNWEHFEPQDFGWLNETWNAWMAQGAAPAIEPVKQLYLQARRLGVDVVFLSGRREAGRDGTEKNLRTIGCADYAALILRPADSPGKAADFKTAERRRLTEAGRTIVLNIGDQDSDLTGGYAEKTFLLPNPAYRSE
jgi:predicted secreted acid phosphatase